MHSRYSTMSALIIEACIDGRGAGGRGGWGRERRRKAKKTQLRKIQKRLRKVLHDMLRGS